MKKLKLLILGAGGHGRVCGEIGYKVEYLDDNAPGVAGKLDSYIEKKDKFENAFVAIGNPKLREEWFEKLQAAGYKMVSLISEKALVSPSSLIEEGSMIMQGAVVQANTKIGKCCIISAGAVVDHDTKVGSFSHINCGGIVPSMSNTEKGTKVDYGEVWRNV